MSTRLSPTVPARPFVTPLQVPTVTPASTATHTAEPTATPIPSPTATYTAESTSTAVPINVPEPPLTATRPPLPTRTPEPTATATNTPVPTATHVPTPAATPSTEPTATTIPSPTATHAPEPTATPQPISAGAYAESVGLPEESVSALSSWLGSVPELTNLEKKYIDRAAAEQSPELRRVLANSLLIQDGIVSDGDVETLEILLEYHPQLAGAVLSPPPESASGYGFLSDGVLSEEETHALWRGQSVFGLPGFHSAWELDTLPPNHLQSVLHILTFYGPYGVVNDITADLADPGAEGAMMTRALEDFGVSAGSCVYCKGQSYDSREQYLTAVAGSSHGSPNPIFERTKLLNLVHHATVQADHLSPCDLNDFSEEELLSLGVMMPGGSRRLAYSGSMPTFTHSVRVTEELLASAREGAAAHGVDRSRIPDDPGLLVNAGEVLSPFTHAMRATGGVETGRGMEQCLEAVKGIVDWDRKRYYHFLNSWEETMIPFLEYIFPENPYVPPVWATFLVYESGGQDKGERLLSQFRALNMPAVKHIDGIYLDGNAERSIISRGNWGIFLPAFRLYIHRNIGFSRADVSADIDNLVQEIRIPDHCGLRRGEGSFRDGTVRVEYVCSEKTRGITDPPEGILTAMSVGQDHACGLRRDGTAVCWGSNAQGQSSPPPEEKFTHLSAGFDHTCALREDGTAVCWGGDVEGQSSPPTGEKFMDISSGFGYSCALTRDGAPVCWGYDIFDQPTREMFLSLRFKDIEAGEISMLCGVQINGGVFCLGETPDESQEGGFSSVSVGRHHACALSENGTAVCWGSDDVSESTPPAGDKFTDIGVGFNRACGLRQDGTAVCWGDDFGRQPSPLDGKKFKDIDAGTRWDSTVCALRENGTAICWH